jgi:hypothetical protein
MTNQPYNADKLELLIDGHHGIYIPKLFADYYPQFLTDTQKQELSSPDNEEYWDCWAEVLDNLVMTNDKGEKFILIQEDGDLWAMPENMEYPES